MMDKLYDLRIQKIGTHYRVFKRTTVSGNWKTNTGTAMIEMIKLEPRFKFWADECAKFAGGMDIVTVDVLGKVSIFCTFFFRFDVSQTFAQKSISYYWYCLLVTTKDEEYILEFNGTASGFGEKEADNLVLKEYK